MLEPGDAVFADTTPLVVRGDLQARAAVGAAALVEGALQILSDEFIFPAAGAMSFKLMACIPARRNLQSAGQFSDGMIAFHGVDHLESPEGI